MRDNEIMKILIPFLTTSVADYLVANNVMMPAVKVQQNYQPHQQGTPLQPVVALHKLSNTRYGFPLIQDKWNIPLQRMEHTEEEVIENIYQVNTLVIQDPSDTEQVTSSDLCNIVAEILQSAKGNKYLHDNGLNVYRIQPITNVYFQDDRDRQEASPSFDFTLQHKTTTISLSPIVTKYETAIYPI